MTEKPFDPAALALFRDVDIVLAPATPLGLPVVAVPVWTAGERLPLGVQILAPPWREDLTLRVARALERDGVVSAPVAGFA